MTAATPKPNPDCDPAGDPADTFAYRPGLIALVRLAEKARTSAEMGNHDTIPLAAAIASAEAATKQSANEKSYAPAIRTQRHAIRALDVPEAKLSVLNLFDPEQW